MHRFCFEERSDAFNLKYELQHFSQQAKQRTSSGLPGEVEVDEDGHYVPQREVDLAHLRLSTTETMKINIKLKGKESSTKSKKRPQKKLTKTLLAPPSAIAPQAELQGEDDDDFGDFEFGEFVEATGLEEEAPPSLAPPPEDAGSGDLGSDKFCSRP